MNFESFKLPPLLIRDLYKNCLVDARGIESADKKPGIDDYTLGENLKNILIVLNAPETAMISEENLNFLTGILKACKLSMKDVAVFNLASLKHTKYTNLLEKFNPGTVLLFGVTPQEIDLPINFPEYKILNYRDVQFLTSPSLDLLQNDKALKSKLWACLQQLFL
jgi:DNA polymerase III psi subunit